MLNFHESPNGIIGFLEIISEYDSNQRGNFGTQEQVVSICLISILLFKHKAQRQKYIL